MVQKGKGNETRKAMGIGSDRIISDSPLDKCGGAGTGTYCRGTGGECIAAAAVGVGDADVCRSRGRNRRRKTD